LILLATAELVAANADPAIGTCFKAAVVASLILFVAVATTAAGALVIAAKPPPMIGTCSRAAVGERNFIAVLALLVVGAVITGVDSTGDGTGAGGGLPVDGFTPGALEIDISFGASGVGRVLRRLTMI